MSPEFFTSVIAWGIVALIALLIIGYLFHWFYRRSTKETAFVRTGLGGQKVVIGGGAFVVPLFHDVTPVGMRTQRLEVSRTRDKSLITKDRMRADVTAEFFVRVAPNRDSVAIAAQALGRRSLDADGLRELVEGKFVDTLRSVAAEMTMEELHEKRGDYVQRVRKAIGPVLEKSGLEAEAVSLTQLDQTDMEHFNPSNAFDAEGLTRLTEEIERRKKERNDIEQDTLIAIRNKNLQTEKLGLDIDRETEFARIDQERLIEIQRVGQRSELTQERAARELAAQQAELTLQEGIERSRIAQQLSIESQKIHREIELQRLETQRRTSQQITEQKGAIEVAEHSRMQSMAQAAAELARADAVSAEEQVFTTREVAVADRRKRIELITASQEAERSSTKMLIEAKAQKEAATERAEAMLVTATGEADADKIRSLAAKIRHEIEAEGQRLSNEAQNVLSPEARNSMLRRLLIERLEGIVRESVKPMERIGEIKIMQVDGMMGGGGGHSNGADHSYGQNLSDQVVNSALRYRAQGPLIDKLLKELGIPGGSIQNLMGADLHRLAGLADDTAAEAPRRITVTPPEGADEGK